MLKTFDKAQTYSSNINPTVQILKRAIETYSVGEIYLILSSKMDGALNQSEKYKMTVVGWECLQ